MRISIKEDGTVHLKMLESPQIEKLSDYDLIPLYRDGIRGRYYYSEEANCFKLVCNRDAWYDEDALDYVTAIYLGNDGYLYFSMETFQGPSEGYKTTDGAYNAKYHTNQGPKYNLIN